MSLLDSEEKIIDRVLDDFLKTLWEEWEIYFRKGIDMSIWAPMLKSHSRNFRYFSPKTCQCESYPMYDIYDDGKKYIDTSDFLYKSSELQISMIDVEIKNDYINIYPLSKRPILISECPHKQISNFIKIHGDNKIALYECNEDLGKSLGRTYYIL